MYLATGQRLKWRLLCVLLLILPSINAQFHENSEPPYKFQPPQFNDPIRRALGLWSRLLNRMSQPNDPTDDQLHLRVEDGEKSAFEDLPSLFGNLLKRQGGNGARFPPIQSPLSSLSSSPTFSLNPSSPSNSIINEERLNQLLPRTRQEQVVGKVEEVKKVEEKKVEEKKETVKPPTKESTKKSTKKSTTKKPTEEPKNDSSTEGTTTQPSKPHKSKKHHESQNENEAVVSLEQNDGSQTTSVEEQNTSSAENESLEEERTTTRKVLSTTVKFTKKPVVKTTEKPKTEAVTKKVTKSVSTTLPTTQKPTSTSKIQKTKLKAVLHVTPVEDEDIPTVTTPITESTTKSHKTTQKDFELEALKRVKSEEVLNDFESSGQEPIQWMDEEELLRMRPSASAWKKAVDAKAKEQQAKNNKKHSDQAKKSTKGHKTEIKFAINDDEPTTAKPTKSTTQKSTTPKPTTQKSTTIKSTKKWTTTKATTTTEQPSTTLTTEALTTTTKKWQAQKIRKGSGENSNEAVIPEAEEAEFQTDDQIQTTTITTKQFADHNSKNRNPFNSEESQENEKKMEKMLTPVSSIIDGIGPLILPLLGYSRQTVAGIFNPASASLASAASGARAAGVRNFRPQQTSNAQIVRSPSGRQTLEGLSTFQQAMSPFQQQRHRTAFQQASRGSDANSRFSENALGQEEFATRNSESFQQAPLPQKSYGPKQSQVKNHVVEPVNLPPADYFNQRGGDNGFIQEEGKSSATQIGQNPTFNRMVNAETNGFAQRYVPESSTGQVDQATMLEVYRQILARRGLHAPSLRGVNEDQLIQIAQLASKIPRNQNQFIGINEVPPASKSLPPEIRRQPSADDPGYQMGRSNVVSSFYEDSGLMVGTKPNGAPPPQSPPDEQQNEESNSIGTGGGGFGGGRRPDSSFEQAALATVEDERLF